MNATITLNNELNGIEITFPEKPLQNMLATLKQNGFRFFQVIALVGEKSVRVREVYPTIASRDSVSGMAEDRVYKITNEILPPASYSVFIKDQENGDLKRLKPGYYQDEEEAKKHCHFAISSFADAYKCNGETEKTYESWYY